MKVLVIGATGGSGLAALRALLAEGHEVTALARRPAALQGLAGPLRIVQGDATRLQDMETAVRGQDAVVVTLGISESALRVRLLGSARTAMDIRSQGTAHAIEAMRRHSVRKLVVQSSFGVGETRDKLPWLYRWIFKLLLEPQIADTERQERAVRASGLDWVIAQPVNLTDASDSGTPFASAAGDVRGMKISRERVGRFLAEAVRGTQYLGRSVALSAA